MVPRNTMNCCWLCIHPILGWVRSYNYAALNQFIIFGDKPSEAMTVWFTMQQSSTKRLMRYVDRPVTISKWSSSANDILALTAKTNRTGFKRQVLDLVSASKSSSSWWTSYPSKVCLWERADWRHLNWGLVIFPAHLQWLQKRHSTTFHMLPEFNDILLVWLSPPWIFRLLVIDWTTSDRVLTAFIIQIPERYRLRFTQTIMVHANWIWSYEQIVAQPSRL